MIHSNITDGRRRYYFEGYDSPEELIATIKSRPLPSYASHHGYVTGEGKPDRWFHGFTSAEDLMKKMVSGPGDPEKIAMARDFAEKMTAERLKKTQMSLSIAGSRANVPRVCMNHPACRVRAFHPKEGIKTLRITVDMGILGDIEPEEVERVGRIIVSAIAALEADNYRIRLDVCTMTAFNGGSYMIMRMNVKELDKRMNLSQFMFWCGSVCVNRGLSFNWRATHPSFQAEWAYGMGRSTMGYSSEFKSQLEFIRDRFFLGGIYLNMMSIIYATRRMTDEQASEYVQDLMVGEVNGS